MANNPYVNKVVYNNNTLIDITDTTATASDVASGKYFYAADGSKTEGTASGGGNDDINGLIQRTISGSYYNSEVTKIGSYAFYMCSSLTTANFPNVTHISNYAFTNCSSLTTANFPNATSIGSYAFNACSSLTTVSFPNATSIGSYAFNACSNLTTANFPSVTSIGYAAFSRCSNLTTANFPNATSIGSYAFASCINLESLYIGTSNCVLTNTIAFQNTPMSKSTYLGRFGSIYVPSAYLSNYISSTNWSLYSARLVGY